MEFLNASKIGCTTPKSMVLEQLVEAVGNRVSWEMQALSSASTQPIEVTGLDPVTSSEL